MFEHVDLVVRDLDKAGDFYRTVLASIGVHAVEDQTEADRRGWLVFSAGGSRAPYFVISTERPAFWTDEAAVGRAPTHLAFTAPSRSAVDAFHRVGVAIGARNNGSPGVRRGDYYCAALIDPDGNNIEAGIYHEAWMEPFEHAEPVRGPA